MRNNAPFRLVDLHCLRNYDQVSRTQYVVQFSRSSLPWPCWRVFNDFLDDLRIADEYFDIAKLNELDWYIIITYFIDFISSGMYDYLFIYF